MEHSTDSVENPDQTVPDSNTKDLEDDSHPFIKWDRVPGILDQTNSHGVKCTFIIKPDGTLLSCAAATSSGPEIVRCAPNPRSSQSLRKLVSSEVDLRDGEEPADKDPNGLPDWRVLAGLAASVWRNYDNDAREAFGAEGLHFVIVECESGQLAICEAGPFVVCLFGDQSVNYSVLRAKACTIANFLEEQLSSIIPTDERSSTAV
eukprot:225834_1